MRINKTMIIRVVGNKKHLASLAYSKPIWRLLPWQVFFFNFAKSCILSWLSQFYNKKFHCAVLKYKHLKLKLKVFITGHSVAMVTFCVTKMIPTCSPVIRQFIDTIIVASIDKEW